MSKVNLFSAKDAKVSDVSLPKDLEGKENRLLLAQAIHIYNDRGHYGLAKAQTRSEVNRTTKKWYRQKGTGGARHGARSAPIFVGGGVAHGPRPISRELNLPKKMRKIALRAALAYKLAHDNIALAEGLSEIKKTREAGRWLTKVTTLLKKQPKRTTLVLSDAQPDIRVFRNLEKVETLTFKDLNAHNVFFGGYLIFDKNIFTSKTETKAAPKEGVKKTVKTVKKTTKKSVKSKKETK